MRPQKGPKAPGGPKGSKQATYALGFGHFRAAYFFEVFGVVWPRGLAGQVWPGFGLVWADLGWFGLASPQLVAACNRPEHAKSAQTLPLSGQMKTMAELN